jgi:hypothetical protein
MFSNKNSYQGRKEEPEKIEFELKDDESNSTEKLESEEEDPHTPIFRRSVHERRQSERYTLSDFRSNFTLSITDEDLRTVREAMDSYDGKLWKKKTWLKKWKSWKRMRLGI